MKVLFLSFMTLLVFSCSNKNLELIIQDIPSHNKVYLEVENDIIKLRKEVLSAKLEKKFSQLKGEEKIDFLSRVNDLTKNLNKTISSMKGEYNAKELDLLKVGFRRTETIWDYIIKNYRI